MALDLNDKTANGNTLTNVGGTEVTTSLPYAAKTEAVDLESTESDYLWAADSVSLSITGNLSLECYVKFESLPVLNAHAHFFSKNDGAAESYRFFYTAEVLNGLRVILSTDGSYQALNDVRVAWTPSLGVWYDVQCTFNTSTSEVIFYVDGTQQGAAQGVSAASIFNNTKKLGLGATGIDTTPADFVDGVMTEYRVWNTVRTQAELDANKAVLLTGNESGLAAYWPLQTLTASAAKSSNLMSLGVG